MKSFFKFASVFGHWTALVAILMLMLGSEQRTSAQTTIQVTTTQQGSHRPHPLLSARGDLCGGICEQHSVESD